MAQPGTTVTFHNVLTNRGTLAETFNILLGAGTFPAGTPLRLYGPDGTTPLADTNGDGIPDVGALAPGQSVRIVVKADLPATLVPGEYSVQKTAQAARSPSRRATASDVVAAVEYALPHRAHAGQPVAECLRPARHLHPLPREPRQLR